MDQRNACSVGLGILTALLIAGCSSVRKAEYPATADPATEVSKLTEDIEKSVGMQADVVAPKEIRKSQENLKDARKELADGDMDDFWEEMAESRGYLNRAQELYNLRSNKVTPVLNQRQAAIDSGARKFKSTREELDELDESFRANSRSLDAAKVDQDIWNRAAINYAALRVNAIREEQVGEARSLIREARKDGARVYAPQTLAQADQALQNAEKVIAENPDSPEVYQPAAAQANEAARTLVAVNATARNASGKSNEEVARRMVAQNRQLATTKGELAGASAEASLAMMTLRSEQEWNKALEEARAEFTEDEAEVYRQGDKLLIRLKQINFPTGSAKVPEKSKPLLTKVSTVIEELNAKNVEVQGHTDSTGGMKVNKKISKARAESVAGFLKDEVEEMDVDLKAVGYGYQHPIASDKSKAGRATNRRVDVVIVPTRVGASEVDKNKAATPEQQ